MPWTGAAGGAFAMHEQLSSITIDRMLLNLTGVVRYVVEQRELRIRQDLAEGTTHKMCDDLAIGERAVGGGTHCAQIVLSQFRMNWGAGKFAIRNRPIPLNHHALEIVRPNLMA